MCSDGIFKINNARFLYRDRHNSNLRFLFNHCSTIIIIIMFNHYLKKNILCNSCVIEKEHSNSDINDLFKLLILKQTQCSRLKLSVLFVMKWDVILRRMIVNSEIVSFFIANQSSLDKKIVISFYKNIITNLIIRMAFNRQATFDW